MTGDKAPKKAPKDNLSPAWSPGQSGNPKGRPKGSRNKFGEDFCRAIAADFEEHGATVLETVRSEDPAAYLRVCASIVPKELNVKVDPIAELTDEQLIKRLSQLQQSLRDLGGDSAVVVRAGEAAEEKPVKPVSSLH